MNRICKRLEVVRTLVEEQDDETQDTQLFKSAGMETPPKSPDLNLINHNNMEIKPTTKDELMKGIESFGGTVSIVKQ